MVKLPNMPSANIISGWKGIVDFYVYHHSAHPECNTPGVPCARRWPRSPGHHRSPAVEAQWAAFTWASSNWNNLSPVVRDAYNDLARGTKLTGRDMFTKSFLHAQYVRLE